VAHLNPVVILTNLVDIMPPKHKMEVDGITICVFLNTKVNDEELYTHNGYGTQTQGQYNNNQWGDH
jgi:hypothetical protein